MTTLAIIQGRMSSSRLPGKILLDIAGKPMLQRVFERTQRSRTLDTVIFATTTDPTDDPVAAFCASRGIPHTRGDLHDVLDRYYQAAKPHQPDVVVRITADCPLIDPDVIDQTVALITSHLPLSTDFSCNRLPPPFRRTLPIGLDVEACTFAALEKAWQESKETFHREHVMPYLYEGTTFQNDTEYAIRNPQSAIPNPYFVLRGKSSRNFDISQLYHTPDYGNLRWTVDTPEDLTFMREIFARLKDTETFNWYDVLEIVQREPQLAQINAAVHHKTLKE
jgi:spore coat polysaccharide biosynthesis protein SpsF